MSKHNFPLHNIKMRRVEEGRCIECGKNPSMTPISFRCYKCWKKDKESGVEEEGI